MGFKLSKNLDKRLHGMSVPVEAHFKKETETIDAYGPEKTPDSWEKKGRREEVKDSKFKVSQWRKDDNKKKSQI